MALRFQNVAEIYQGIDRRRRGGTIGNLMKPPYTTSLAFRSSAVGHIDTWKSPVFLQQGDDDRNVDFAQMVGLVDLLRARGVYYELTVTPDDVHESLIHSRWIDIFGRSSDFLRRFVWDKQPPPVSTNNGAK